MRIFFTFRHSINAWLIRNILLATNQLWDIRGGPRLPVRKHWFIFVHPCIHPSHHLPHSPFWQSSSLEWSIHSPPSRRTMRRWKGGGWKLKNQEGSLNKDSETIPVLYSNHDSYRIMYIDKKIPLKLCRCMSGWMNMVLRHLHLNIFFWRMKPMLRGKFKHFIEFYMLITWLHLQIWASLPHSFKV